ncbi:uncharacterized protein LOC119740583 [Patiria miniata]|uniref:Uncharacterized protein n=1 Tax=Patiria miniata TaxID=46514 RepID=A0A914B7B7_PATMI|nr:uncharacterized protein LOC119740583 [Patiria miniata]XP_038071858.1 uncharacterized protein LOC119740583 [Patiria miniata]XP_038071859.1 uncharacterized protein LOC119740583 [Patiria miniata]
MSSESDGEGSSRGWTLVDKHGHTEVSEDSSGSSSDFVDLGEDSVRYHHVSRSTSVIDITPGNSASSSSLSSSSLPANFRAHGGASGSREDPQNSVSSDVNTVPTVLPGPSVIPEVAEIFHGDGALRPLSYLTSQEGCREENIPAANRQSSDLGSSASSSASTLTGSQSPLLLASYSNGVASAGDQVEGAGTHSESPANILTSGNLDRINDAEPDALGDQMSYDALDNISVDSIEVLSMPSEESHFLEDGATMGGCGDMIQGRTEEAEDDQKLDVVPALLSMAAVSPETEMNPHQVNESQLSSGNEGSDTSEFERIDPEMVPAVDEGENQTIDAAEEGKMDVAGARPTEELEDEPLSDVSFLRPPYQPRNFLEMPSCESEDVHNSFLQSSVPSPPVNPNMPASPASHMHPWSGQSASSIQPFPFDHLPAGRIGLRHRASSGDSSAGLQLKPPGRFGLPHQRSNSSSDEGFELIRRPRVRDDDEVSTVSSSSSDLSGFVNVRQRRGPPLSRSVSQRHSDFDDTLDSVSNFTDISEDCLPANMMIQSQKSGVRQYRHRRDEGLNTRLDWLVAMVLLAGLALGIGHFIGSTQEMAHQHSINTGQVQRLRELQDDLVTCLDRSSGIDSRITTEKSSPALQAVKLLEGLNSKMKEEGLDTSHLLEQQVGDKVVKVAADSDLHPTERTESGEEALSGSGVSSDEKSAYKNAMETQPSSRIHSTDDNLEDSNDSLDVTEPENFHRADDKALLGFNEQAMLDKLSPDHHVMSSDEEFKILVDAPVVSVESKKLVLDMDVAGRVEDLKEAAKETPDDTSSEGKKMEDLQLQVKDVDQQFVGDDSIEYGPEKRPKSFEYYDEKIESLEEKMEELMQTAQHWQEMFEESKKEESSGEAESQKKDKESSGKDQGDQDSTEKDDDPVAGIGGTLQSLWSDWLGTDHGKAILHYLNQTQVQSVLLSEAFIRELDSLKALPDSEQVQAILNNTKLLAKHLGKEVESVTGYLKNQSAKLVKENNITAENMGEKAGNAWMKLKNVTSDVVDYNQKVLSMFSEQLVDTLHSVENISSEFIAEQNLSMSRVTNMAEQAWGTVKNYSSIVTETILNKTSESMKTSPQSESVDDPETEPNEKIQGGFGEKLRGAWDTVRNYSSNFTSKQNLSISGLREQVKAAWGKVKNTSAQVMEDISESNLAGKLKDGATKLGEKVGTTIKSVKEKIKGLHSRKGHHGKKKHHHDHSERHRQAERGNKKKNKKPKDRKRHEKHKDKKDYSSGRSDKKDTHKQHNKHQRNHQRHTNDKRHRSSKDHIINPGKRGKTYHQKQFSVPSRWHHRHQQYDESDTENIHSTSDLPSERDQDYLNSAPSRPHWDRPSHGKAESVEDGDQKQDATDLKREPSLQKYQQNSVPSRQQMKVSHDAGTQDQPKSENSRPNIPEKKQTQPKSVPSRQQMWSTDDVRNQQRAYRSEQEVLKDEKMTSIKHGCPPQRDGLGSSEDGESDTVSNWEELFDCIDMHCKGNEKCMHSQRRDAARLYSELLDYQVWLKERNLRKDVRELKEFLEELGEFLSETDSDDKDLDELKDEFGEMVQDMEEGALKRQQKQGKYRDHKAYQSDKDQDTQRQGGRAIINEPDEVENSTVVIDLKTLPQKQDSSSDTRSHHPTENTEKRKYAGRGFQSSGDENDWYLRRAEVRAEQRKSHHWMGDEKHKDTPNWYLHWVQGRINGRTGVTVWDMYEWIKERYMLREELRRHDIEDHTNWFLRRP